MSISQNEAIGKPSKKVSKKAPAPSTTAPALAIPEQGKEYQWSPNGFCSNPDQVLEHVSKNDYVLISVACTDAGTWAAGCLWRYATGSYHHHLVLSNKKFTTSAEAVSAEVDALLADPKAEKLTPNTRRILEHFRGTALPFALPLVSKPAALASVLVATQAPVDDVQRAGRRQEPVAPFEVAGQAARLAAAAEPAAEAVPTHRVGWATVTSVQLYHHYDEAGRTACGYKRRKGELLFSEKPGDLPAWQCCRACDATFVRGAGREAAIESAPAPLPNEQPAEALLPPSAQVQDIALADIDTSRNYRQVFDEADLAELAESIKAHGVMQPVLVRPTPTPSFLNGQGSQRYQLVYGGRRYKASALAGLATIPATVRELSDLAFAEMQLVENVQRKDVRPSDEARAFNDLLNKHKLSPEELALRVGRPVKFVLQRAKLVTLVPFWMELLEADRLPLVAAHELARIPPHSQVLVKKAFENGWEIQRGGPLSSSSIQNAIQREVMRKLVSAAFPKDDATLCIGAGACVTCPKNSANHHGLFDEASDESEAKCLDSACFADKREAYLARRLKEVAGTNTTLVSSSYDNPPAGALGYKFYDRANEGDKGAVQALVVDGLDAGSMKWVKLSNSVPNAEAAAQDKKAKRSAEIREGKISENFRQLLTGHLYTAALEKNQVLESHLDKQIYSELRSQGGPHTVLRFALVEQMGWEMPEGGEVALKKLTPASNFEALNAWQSKNVSRLSYAQKLALYFALLGYNCSTFDSSNERLQQYAKAAGANTKSLKEAATNQVDSKGKKGEAQK